MLLRLVSGRIRSDSDQVANIAEQRFAGCIGSDDVDDGIPEAL